MKTRKENGVKMNKKIVVSIIGVIVLSICIALGYQLSNTNKVDDKVVTQQKKENKKKQSSEDKKTTLANKENKKEVAKDEPKKEEVKQEEPVQQTPTQQAPVQQEPVYKEPVQQAPVQQEPVYKEPVQQEPQQPTTCVIDGTYGRLGNSGKVFNSLAEAEAWAQQEWNDKNSPWYDRGYDAITVIDNCGNERNDLWTIGFR